MLPHSTYWGRKKPTPEEALERLRASPVWKEMVETGRARLAAGFSKKPKATPMAGGEIRVHVLILGQRRQVNIHEARQSRTFESDAKFIFGQIFLFPVLTDAFNEAVEAEKRTMDWPAGTTTRDDWWLEPLEADIRGAAGEARCTELTRQIWDVGQEAVPLVGAKVSAHKNGVARRALVRAVAAAAAAGLTHSEMTEVVDEAMVKTIMER